jgi:hypothetical protein
MDRQKILLAQAPSVFGSGAVEVKARQPADLAFLRAKVEQTTLEIFLKRSQTRGDCELTND